MQWLSVLFCSRSCSTILVKLACIAFLISSAMRLGIPLWTFSELFCNAPGCLPSAAIWCTMLSSGKPPCGDCWLCPAMFVGAVLLYFPGPIRSGTDRMQIPRSCIATLARNEACNARQLHVVLLLQLSSHAVGMNLRSTAGLIPKAL